MADAWCHAHATALQPVSPAAAAAAVRAHAEEEVREGQGGGGFPPIGGTPAAPRGPVPSPPTSCMLSGARSKTMHLKKRRAFPFFQPTPSHPHSTQDGAVPAEVRAALAKVAAALDELAGQKKQDGGKD